jgi:anaerobic selenocysteine-containing dehydrogenase
VLRELGVTARGDVAFLPHHEPQAAPSGEDEFPLEVHVFRMHPTTTRPREGELERPRISDFLGLRRAEVRTGWCELSPRFAEGAGIEEGDTVWVESPAGRVRLRARLHLGTMPRVVNLPRGLARGVLGGLLDDAPSGLDVLTANTADRLGGFPAWRPTRVRVYSA